MCNRYASDLSWRGFSDHATGFIICGGDGITAGQRASGAITDLQLLTNIQAVRRRDIISLG
ncbi:hypothetical protein BG55_14605 [Erwinia mallotivora]|uniref:Uncharacterized protein n=1 Tax=Erwinia mallotivora TaxID=69222 RepID=A0A014N6M0_9GAMM|nr:hypothetical protein BG55_14605 [Erwinia mallotivora]